MTNLEKYNADKGFHVLIAAAGRGQRASSDIPKQYKKIKGLPVLRHTLEKFIGLSGLKSLRVIINSEHAKLYHDAVTGLDIGAPIYGGDERNISVLNGLEALVEVKDNEIVLIHDAARPCVKRDDILNLVNACHECGAASLAVKIFDTIAKGFQETIEDYTDRDNKWLLQTPQGFKKDIILKAHQATKNDNVTDDTSLVKTSGQNVRLVEGSRSNIKITTIEDFVMAEKLLAGGPFETRTGTGFDVHAFDVDKSGPVKLCGVDIPHDHPLKGHSDADVGLHAITDALYGAMAEGDIGTHFPPTDNTYKDMDSAVFLQHAVDMLGKKGGKLVNIDLTLICEAPKIAPYASAMIKRTAAIMEVDEKRISIKATTTEQLGFTGRRQGIAAQAVATIELPS